MKIAVMGCIVNSLGETREADLAIVGRALITKKGKIVKRIKTKNVFEEFKKELSNYL